MTKKMLIVEDDEDIQNYYSFLFAGLDLRIERAFTGEEALECLEKKTDFDLILLDVVLPGIGGEEVFRVLREERKISVPVIVSSVDERMSRRVSEIGEVQGVFTKGTRGEELKELINRVLNSTPA